MALTEEGMRDYNNRKEEPAQVDVEVGRVPNVHISQSFRVAADQVELSEYLHMHTASLHHVNIQISN